MAQWRVQDGSDVRDLTEEKLRKKLRSGDLSGAELARPEGELEWKPLHRFPIFREEVPFQGGSVGAARARVIWPMVWHFAAFVTIGHVLLDWQWWMIPWFIGLAFHL